MATVSGASAVTRVQLPGRRHDRIFFGGMWSTHRVHLATALGGGLIAAYVFLAVPIGHTVLWRAFARWVQSWNS